jgi:hypothetical protein
MTTPGLARRRLPVASAPGLASEGAILSTLVHFYPVLSGSISNIPVY